MAHEAVSLPVPARSANAYTSPGYYVVDQTGGAVSGPYPTPSVAFANLNGGVSVQYLDAPRTGELLQGWPPELHTVVGHDHTQGDQMTYSEADLLRAMASTQDAEKQRQLMGALENVRSQRHQASAGRSEMGAPGGLGSVATERAPFLIHNGAFGSSSRTDWLADMAPTDEGMTEHMLTMGSRFFLGCHPEVKSDPVEYMTQALGVARVAASQFSDIERAVGIFMNHAASLNRVDMNKVAVDELLPWGAPPEILPPVASDYLGEESADKNPNKNVNPPGDDPPGLGNGASGRPGTTSAFNYLSSHEGMSEFLFDEEGPTPEELAQASGPGNLNQQYGAPVGSQDATPEPNDDGALSGTMRGNMPILATVRTAAGDESDGEYKYIKHRPDAKDSEGQPAPWVIVQKDTGKELSAHTTREKAIEAFKAMEWHKHSSQLFVANQYIKKDGDQWVITQKGTGKILSHHNSEEEAEKAFAAMEWHKHGGSLRVVAFLKQGHTSNAILGSRAFSPQPTTYDEYLSRLAPGSAAVSREFYSGSMAAISPSATDPSVPSWGARQRQGANEEFLNPQAFQNATEDGSTPIRPQSDGYNPEDTWLQSGEAAHDIDHLIPQTDLVATFDNITDFPETGPTGVPSTRREAASSYRGDPFWMVAKYPGRCGHSNCDDLIRKGDRIFYYPKTKTAYVGKHAEAAAADFASAVADEDAYNGYMASLRVGARSTPATDVLADEYLQVNSDRHDSLDPAYKSRNRHIAPSTFISYHLHGKRKQYAGSYLKRLNDKLDAMADRGEVHRVTTENGSQAFCGHPDHAEVREASLRTSRKAEGAYTAALKMVPEHLQILRDHITPLDTEERRERYRSGDFPRANLVKDLDKRYRWDLFHGSHVYDVLGPYSHGYDDTHIDSALKTIVPPLGQDRTAALHTAMRWSPASGMAGSGIGVGDPYGEFSPTHTYNPIGWDVFDAKPHPGSVAIVAGSPVQLHGKMDPSGLLVHIRDENGNHQTVDKRSLGTLRHEARRRSGADVQVKRRSDGDYAIDDDGHPVAYRKGENEAEEMKDWVEDHPFSHRASPKPKEYREETGFETGGNGYGVPGAYEPDRSLYAESPQGQADDTQGYEQAYSSGRPIDYSGTGEDVLGTVPVQGYLYDDDHPNGEMWPWEQEPIGSPPRGAADVAGVPTPGMVSAQVTGNSWPQPEVTKNARLDAFRASVAQKVAAGALLPRPSRMSQEQFVEHMRTHHGIQGSPEVLEALEKAHNIQHDLEMPTGHYWGPEHTHESRGGGPSVGVVGTDIPAWVTPAWVTPDPVTAPPAYDQMQLFAARGLMRPFEGANRELLGRS